MGGAVNLRDLPHHLTMHGPPIPPKWAARHLAQQNIRGDFKAEALHPYTADASGTASHWRIRARLADGSKWIRPMQCRGMFYELGEPQIDNAKKPLYRLHELANADPSLPVLFVEGEAKADALAKRELVATTAGGATSDDKADFEPLRDRHVILWPDNDEPGKAHVQRVAAKLLALGCAVEVLEISRLELPEHGDVVDYLRAHPDAAAADLMALPRTSEIAAPPASETTLPRRVEANLIRPTANLVCAADVQCEPIRWLWNNWLATGKFHVLAGAAGTGKTTVALSMGATVSKGGRWSDGTRCEAGDVVIWSGEDDPSDVLVPRLRAMGADVDRVHFVSGVSADGGTRPFDPATDIEALRRVWPIGTRLLIVDPIVSAVAADSHKNGEVRRSLQPLVDLGNEQACAVLGITHFSKGTAGREPLERVTGSLAFGAMARVVLIAAKLPDKEDRLLAIAKSNIGPDQGGFNYGLRQIQVPKDHKVSQPIWASRVDWGAPLSGSARELLATAEAHGDSVSDTPEEVEGFVLDCLRDRPVTAKQMQADAKGAGHSWDRVKRAARRLGVKPKKAGMRDGWIWALPGTSVPEESAEGSEGSTQNSVLSSHSSGDPLHSSDAQPQHRESF